MLIKFHNSHSRSLNAGVSVFTLLAFLWTSVPPTRAYAQSLPFVQPIQSANLLEPALIKGLTIDSQNPFHFEFIVSRGQDHLDGEKLRLESMKMIKYFLASLTVPEKEMWVNLSPVEKDRIIPDGFGVTEMGRDLLTQDYMLKQLTASLMNPQKDLGEKFWNRVRQKAKEKFGTIDVPTNTFNKVWIVPDRAVVYEHEASAFVVERHLKVMLEEDYLAQEGRGKTEEGSPQALPTSHFSLPSPIIKELIIPAIEQEVNSGKTFASLRQIYNAMILAVWYKKKLRDSIMSQVYVDQNKTKGIDLEDKNVKEKIYAQYMESFKKGVYNLIKEDYDPATQQIVPRKYFSGGVVPVHQADLQIALTLNSAEAAQMTADDFVRIDTAMLGVGNNVNSQAAKEASNSKPEPRSFNKDLIKFLLNRNKSDRNKEKNLYEQIRLHLNRILSTNSNNDFDPKILALKHEQLEADRIAEESLAPFTEPNVAELLVKRQQDLRMTPEALEASLFHMNRLATHVRFFNPHIEKGQFIDNGLLIDDVLYVLNEAELLSDENLNRVLVSGDGVTRKDCTFLIWLLWTVATSIDIHIYPDEKASQNPQDRWSYLLDQLAKKPYFHNLLKIALAVPWHEYGLPEPWLPSRSFFWQVANYSDLLDQLSSSTLNSKAVIETSFDWPDTPVFREYKYQESLQRKLKAKPEVPQYIPASAFERKMAVMAKNVNVKEIDSDKIARLQSEYEAASRESFFRMFYNEISTTFNSLRTNAAMNADSFGGFIRSRRTPAKVSSSDKERILSKLSELDQEHPTDLPPGEIYKLFRDTEVRYLDQDLDVRNDLLSRFFDVQLERSDFTITLGNVYVLLGNAAEERRKDLVPSIRIEYSDAERKLRIVDHSMNAAQLNKALNTLLTTDDPEARQQAVLSLKNTHEPSVMARLVDNLRHSNPDVRVKIFEILASMGDVSALYDIVGIADSPGEPLPIRLAAISALISGGADFVFELGQILVDNNPEIRKAVAHALGEIGEATATEVLLNRLVDHDQSVRLAILNAIEKIGDSRAVLPLQHFRDSEADVNKRKTQVIENLRKKASAAMEAEKAYGLEHMAYGARAISHQPSAISDVGGINLDPELLDLQIKVDGRGMPLPLVDQPPIEMMKIEGFVPIIIDIKPIANMPFLLGLVDKKGNPIATQMPAEKARELEKVSMK